MTSGSIKPVHIVTSIVNQRKLLLLALPMILSNITTPLLGLVDTAVIGHLDQAYYLGGIAVGSMMISISFWLMGFLRMSTTGVVAQSLGENKPEQAWGYFFHSAALALLLALMLLLLHQPLLSLALNVVAASEQVSHYAAVYVEIRIFSAPAVLLNLVVLGFFVARQQVKWVVVQLFTINVINISLDLLFVVEFEWGVAGAAKASVIADYCGLLLLCFVLWPQAKAMAWRRIMRLQKEMMVRLFSLNRDIFIRSLALQLCLAFVTASGARMGDITVAANAILLNFFMFASYGLDGFAYAAESLVGQAKGQQNRRKIDQIVIASIAYCLITVSVFCLVLWGFKEHWIGLLTSLADVQNTALEYLPWLIGACAIGWLSFMMDGIYIGLTRAKEMRNSMLLAAMVFFALWYATQAWQNHGLWLAFCGFMLVRGVSLLADYWVNVRTETEIKNG